MAFLLILLVEKLMKVQKLANLKQRKEKWKSDQSDFYFKEIPVMFGLGLCVVSLMMYGVYRMENIKIYLRWLSAQPEKVSHFCQKYVEWKIWQRARILESR